MEDIELPKKAKTHKGKVYLNSLLPINYNRRPKAMCLHKHKNF